MHQHFFTQIGYQTQRRLGSFAKQVAQRHYENIVVDECINLFEPRLIPMRAERYSGSMEDKFMFFEAPTEECSADTETVTSPTTDYHHESIRKVSEFVGPGKYCLSFHVEETDITKFWPRWSHHDRNAAGKPIHPELCYALLLHAKANKWSGVTEVEGYTTVKQMDPMTQQIYIHRSDALFHGEKNQTLGIVHL